MHRLIFIIGVLVLIFSCKQKASLEKLEGKYVTNIRQNQIVTADGEVYDIPIEEDGTVFYLIRHAEKDSTSQASDPPLSRQGEKRSVALYDMFRGTDLDLIYSTMYMRTIATVQVIADQKGMSIKAYNPQELRKLHSSIVDSTDAKRVLIVGHSNTTPVLANFLSDTKYYTSSFAENEYDNLIIVLDNGPENKELIPVKFKP